MEAQVLICTALIFHVMPCGWIVHCWLSRSVSMDLFKNLIECQMQKYVVVRLLFPWAAQMIEYKNLMFHKNIVQLEYLSQFKSFYALAHHSLCGQRLRLMIAPKTTLWFKGDIHRSVSCSHSGIVTEPRRMWVCINSKIICSSALGCVCIFPVRLSSELICVIMLHNY